MSKTVLITGAGSGFGRGAAVALAARGHTVIATVETADQAAELAAAHPELTVAKLDVTDPDDLAGRRPVGPRRVRRQRRPRPDRPAEHDPDGPRPPRIRGQCLRGTRRCPTCRAGRCVASGRAGSCSCRRSPACAPARIRSVLDDQARHAGDGRRAPQRAGAVRCRRGTDQPRPVRDRLQRPDGEPPRRLVRRGDGGARGRGDHGEPAQPDHGRPDGPRRGRRPLRRAGRGRPRPSSSTSSHPTSSKGWPSDDVRCRSGHRPSSHSRRRQRSCRAPTSGTRSPSSDSACRRSCARTALTACAPRSRGTTTAACSPAFPLLAFPPHRRSRRRGTSRSSARSAPRSHAKPGTGTCRSCSARGST